MADPTFKGLGVALVTPFQNNLSLDLDSLRALVEHTIEGGCDYLVALGTTAETPTLSFEEKEEVAKCIRECNKGRLPLVLGIGGNDTMGVIRELQRRNLKGYDAILSVTPYYNKPTQEGLFRHFMAIADASPLPVIMYNVPGRTGVNLTANTTIRLSSASSGIIGIKEASANLNQCKEILEGVHDGFFVTSGNDSDTSSFMKIGAGGVISVLANAFPKVVKNIVRLCAESKFDEAEKCQKEIDLVIKRLFEDGNPAGVKAMLEKLGLVKNTLRLPLVPVSESLQQRLSQDVEKLSSLN